MTLSTGQTACLRILSTAPSAGARSSNANRGLFVHGGSAESLVRLGLAERAPMHHRRWYEAERYKITTAGRRALAVAMVGRS